MKFKKLLVSILCVAMVLSLFGTVAFADSAVVITNAVELKSFAQDVNSGITYKDITVQLGNDIELNGEEWEPIGNKDTGLYFEGTFDGAGFEISGLSITASNSREDYEALFGATKNAVIKNLTVSGSVYGANVAAIVARMDGGRIENCISKVNITCIDSKKAGGIVCLTGATADPSFITNCFNYGDIVIEGNHTSSTAGGILAYISNGKGKVTVSGCENYGNVSGGAYAGGICGYCSGGNTGAYSAFEITECINHGTISNSAAGSIAGFVGNSGVADTHKISNCRNTSDVNSSFVAANNDSTNYNEDPSNFNGIPVATVDGTPYANLQEAITAAQANGDTVTLMDDVTYTTVYTSNKTHWNGDLNYELNISGNVVLDLNGHTIKSIGGSTHSYYALICVRSGSLVIQDSSDEKTGSVIWETNNGSAVYKGYTIYNNASLVLNGGTVSNYTGGYAIESVTVKNTKLTINDGAAVTSSGIAVRACSQSSTDTQTIAINGGAISGTYALWVPFKNGGKDVIDVTISGGELTGSSNAVLLNTYSSGADFTSDSVSINGGVFNGNVLIGEQYSNDAGNSALSAVLKGNVISGGVFSNDVSDYIADGYAIAEKSDNVFSIVEAKASDIVELEFEEVPAKEGEKIYNINLIAGDGLINRLNPADLTFALTQGAWGKNVYDIIASNDEVVINNVAENRYEFHYDGKDNVQTDSGYRITIGQVKFTGYGEFSFAVNANATTNAAHATTEIDNIVDSFAPNGILDGKQVGEFDISDNSITNVEVKVPTRELEININFNNAVEKKAEAYQQMTVKVYGGDLEKAIEIKLADVTQTGVDPVLSGKADARYTVDTATLNKYVVTLTDALTSNTTYNVEVSGAGYRTARYSVTMNEDVEGKILNFWNNVKDVAEVVEVNKDASKKNVTFLAGDIVKDSIINIYDLSAVVSYFGETELVGTNNGYAKYDLNRDGKIDSKDVAYVLVSWGN